MIHTEMNPPLGGGREEVAKGGGEEINIGLTHKRNTYTRLVAKNKSLLLHANSQTKKKCLGQRKTYFIAQ